jgi:hypothetical protein
VPKENDDVDLCILLSNEIIGLGKTVYLRKLVAKMKINFI